MYLSVASMAVSLTFVHKEDRIQHPIYYISHVRRDAETWYTMIKKLALALVSSVQKLCPYFHAHHIIVITDYSYNVIGCSGHTRKDDQMVCFVRWVWSGVQILNSYERLGYGKLLYRLSPSTWQCLWQFNCLRSSGEVCWCCAQGTRDRGWDNPPESRRSIIEHVLRLNFPSSNNEAEYEGLTLSFLTAKQLGIFRLHAFSDSQLVVRQVNGIFEAWDPKMIQYLEVI